MALYSGTFNCGHEGTVNVIGKASEREWKIEYAFNKLCPECYRKSLEEEKERLNKEAAEKAKEMELPELKGTEKQISWANTLRQKFIDNIEKYTEDDYKEITKYLYEDLIKIPFIKSKLILDYIITNKTDASFYINNRNQLTMELINDYAKEAFKTDEEKVIEEIKEEIEEELESNILKPENAFTNVPVEIIVNDDKISAKYIKNDKFIEIMKKLHYTWNSKSKIWERKITRYNGNVEDRTAELGNKLLNAGFPILLNDEKLKTKAINGDYEKEHYRWIRIRAKNFGIFWNVPDKKLFYEAIKLPKSKYITPEVVVNIEYYEAVEDFARLYNFKFTDEAIKTIEEYKKAFDNLKTVNPKEIKETIIETKDEVEEILNSSAEILDDLKDD